MKLVEVRVTQAHRGLKVGEVVRVDQRMADVLTSQGRVQRLGGAPEPTAVAPPKEASEPANDAPEAPEADVEFTSAAPLDEAVSKPAKRTRKGRYNRRDMKAKGE